MNAHVAHIFPRLYQRMPVSELDAPETPVSELDASKTLASEFDAPETPVNEIDTPPAPEHCFPGWVYVLRLEDDCWYVGYSADLETRIAQHFLGRGADWTRLHVPVGVESVQRGDVHLETVVTVALMAKYHWKKVRGGRYMQAAMLQAPPPILKAYSRKPPRPLVEPVAVETQDGHTVTYEQLGGCTGVWRAKIGGPKASACSQRGVKMLRAATETDLRAAVSDWLSAV